MSRRRGFTRYSSCSSGGSAPTAVRGPFRQLGQARARLGVVERRLGDPGQHARLEQRQRGATLFLAHAPDRGRDGSVGADDRGGGGEEMGDVGVELTAGRAGGRTAPTRRRCTSSAVARDEMLGVEAAVRDVAWRRMRTCSHASSMASASSGRPCDLFGDEQGERTTGARDHDVRDARARFAGQQHRVRLVLHLLASGREQRRRRVAIRDPAPDAGEELRVGFVAADRDHAERAGRAVGEERSPRASGCSSAARTRSTRTSRAVSARVPPARRSVAAPRCRRSGARAPRPPPEDDRGDHVGREATCPRYIVAIASRSTIPCPTRRVGRAR